MVVTGGGNFTRPSGDNDQCRCEVQLIGAGEVCVWGGESVLVEVKGGGGC